MFSIGQKVVCKDVSLLDHSRRPHIQPGAVYTVRSTCYCDIDRAPGIRLDGVTLPVHPKFGVEYAFFAKYFRPVVEKSTDVGMAILKEILERETVKDDVPVGNMTVKDVMALHDRTMAQLRAWVGR